MTSFLSGKALLLIVTVTAATGGFTLGYFVGQNTAVPPASSLERQLGGDLPSASVRNPSPDIKAEVQSSGVPAEGDLNAENRQGAVTAVSHEAAATPVKGEEKVDTAKPNQGRETDRTELQETDVPPKKKAAYTVQAASFKRQKDADALKQNLEEKGYKASVKKEVNSKGAIFKVRVGEFERKKEASVAAVKLSKTEGLSAFVTSKK